MWHIDSEEDVSDEWADSVLFVTNWQSNIESDHFRILLLPSLLSHQHAWPENDKDDIELEAEEVLAAVESHKTKEPLLEPLQVPQFLKPKEFLELDAKRKPPKFRPHGINRVDLARWIAAHPQKWRSLAIDFSKTFTYVTWKSWLKRFYDLLQYWMQTRPKAQRWAFWLPIRVDKEAVVCKSNFWVTQLAVAYILNRFPKERNFSGIVCGQDSAEIQENMDRYGVTQLLLVDDASYSGGQLKDLVESLEKNLDYDLIPHLMLAVPYVSEEARRAVGEDFFLNDPDKNIVATIHTWMDAPNANFNDQEQRDIKQHILPPNSPLWTTYFQFKMPDWVSVVDAIRTGLVRTGAKTNAWIKFIRNCHADVQCPFGIYKFSTQLCRKFALLELKPKVAMFRKEKRKEWERARLWHDFEADIALAILRREQDEEDEEKGGDKKRENNRQKERKQTKTLVEAETSSGIFTPVEAETLLARILLKYMDSGDATTLMQVFTGLEPYIDGKQIDDWWDGQTMWDKDLLTAAFNGVHPSLEALFDQTKKRMTEKKTLTAPPWTDNQIAMLVVMACVAGEQCDVENKRFHIPGWSDNLDTVFEAPIPLPLVFRAYQSLTGRSDRPRIILGRRDKKKVMK